MGKHKSVLEKITDTVKDIANIAADAADRLIRQELPGGRTVSFAYDSSGNLVALRPPSRPDHAFGYTPVDLTERYSPPPASLTDYETRYAYNRDRQLTHVKRPDSLNVTLGYDAAGAQDYAASLGAFQAYLKLAPAKTAEAQRVHSFLPELAQLAAQQATAPATPTGQ